MQSTQLLVIFQATTQCLSHQMLNLSELCIYVSQVPIFTSTSKVLMMDFIAFQHTNFLPLPHFSGGKIDLKKLYNNPYGGGYKYWTKFGGFGIAAATPFEGCIDDNNQQLMETDAMDVGLLKLSNIQVPGVGGTGWTGSGSWGTSIWINVMSQCQHPGECDAGFGHWWKFEKSLTPSEAEYFAYTHLTPEFADSSVAGTPVVLVYQGQVPCVATASYGCDPGELD